MLQTNPCPTVVGVGDNVLTCPGPYFCKFVAVQENVVNETLFVYNNQAA